MDPAALRPLARTGLEVTALGLGTAPLGELFERVTDAEATGVVDPSRTIVAFARESPTVRFSVEASGRSLPASTTW